MEKRSARVAVIGGGMAGCEAATLIARAGFDVDLYEMKPKKFSEAHKLEGLGELVCSNSLGQEDPDSAPGVLKEEMRALGSVVLAQADLARVPAGKALAVDRDKMSQGLTRAVESMSRIRVVHEECEEIPDHEIVIVCTGPLTSDALASDLAKVVGSESFYFYDSISPIVAADTVDLSKAYFASRYAPENSDYLNCPLDRETYERFVQEILAAEKVPLRTFEAMKCFEACLPIEVLAERGLNTLAFGPMKPVGLEDPSTGRRPHAVVQLRRENEPTTLYNLVGFQTRMKWGEQKRVFRMIPGLENAEFVRFGSMHRNTYFNSPKLLNRDLSLKANGKILIAGQLTGVEGYVESAAMGQWAGLVAIFRLQGEAKLEMPPRETAVGSLLHTITTTPIHGAFAPMNINFGLFPEVQGKFKNRDGRRQMIVERARTAATKWRSSVVPRYA